MKMKNSKKKLQKKLKSLQKKKNVKMKPESLLVLPFNEISIWPQLIRQMPFNIDKKFYLLGFVIFVYSILIIIHGGLIKVLMAVNIKCTSGQLFVVHTKANLVLTNKMFSPSARGGP